MNTLSHGYKKPANPDTGDAWMPAMEDNIQLMNDHTHNGTDGAQLAVLTKAISHTNWVAAPIGGGHYRQAVSISPTLYASTMFEFRLSTGEIVYPSVENISTTSFYVYTTDNTLNYVLYYR